MPSFAFSRFNLCYLPQDGAKTADPHPRHRYEHLLVGWKQATGTAKTGRAQQRKRRGVTMTKTDKEEDDKEDNHKTMR
jgi:hypothetical protein